MPDRIGEIKGSNPWEIKNDKVDYNVNYDKEKTKNVPWEQVSIWNAAAAYQG